MYFKYFFLLLVSMVEVVYMYFKYFFLLLVSMVEVPWNFYITTTSNEVIKKVDRKQVS